MLTQRPSISDGWKAVNLKPQHPDTYLLIRISRWRVSATLYMRPFGYGLLIAASVRPHSLSGHEAEQSNLRGSLQSPKLFPQQSM